MPEDVVDEASGVEESSMILYAPEVDAAGGERAWEEVPPQGQGVGTDGRSAESRYQLNDSRVTQCLAGVDTSTLPMQTYSSTLDGTIALNCGTDSAGLRHIADSHALDWTAKMGGFSGSWYDYMSFGVDSALQAPVEPVYNTTRNTRCYTTPVEVYDSSGSYVETFYARTGVSVNNQIVITAFPRNHSNC